MKPPGDLGWSPGVRPGATPRDRAFRSGVPKDPQTPKVLGLAAQEIPGETQIPQPQGSHATSRVQYTDRVPSWEGGPWRGRPRPQNASHTHLHSFLLGLFQKKLILASQGPVEGVCGDSEAFWSGPQQGCGPGTPATVTTQAEQRGRPRLGQETGHRWAAALAAGP